VTLPGQIPLLCGCGSSRIFARGRCASCYWEWRNSVRHFAGLRDRVLIRDGRLCCACGEVDPARLIVHHRRPGVHQMRLLLSLCRGCHARVHRTWRPRYGFPESLRTLWREQYPGLAEQLELGLESRGAGDSPIIQALLFEAA
jgi:hypothetical protein